MPDDASPYRPVSIGPIPADHPMLDTGPIVDLMGVHAAGLEQARVEALRAEGEFFASLRRAAAMGPCATRAATAADPPSKQSPRTSTPPAPNLKAAAQHPRRTP